MTTRDISEVLFYIHESVQHKWNKYELREALKKNLYKEGHSAMPSNFVGTLPTAKDAVRDYSKPMGVATYKTFQEMPVEYRNALPDPEELKKLL